MNLNEFLKIQVQNNPSNLLVLLVKTAIVSILIVVSMCTFGFYRLFSGFVIKNAENNSVQLCNLLIDKQKEFMFVAAPGKESELGLHGTEMFAFDVSVRDYLYPFSIIKVKIYNTAKRIIYCTDPMLIGKVDDKNKRLANALVGNVDAKMVTKDKAVDLADEELRDVDVVETYVPIFSSDKKVIGCFEVYINITGYREQIREGVVLMTSVLVAVLMAVFGFSYLLIRGGTGQLKEAQDKLETIAVTDTLTTLANRGYLISRGEEEFVRISRNRLKNQRPMDMGCIMIDIDHFKKVNDTYGHLAGDVVLKEVARRLSMSVRPYDVLGRYGGEEFVVMLPDTTVEHCMIVAARIRENIRTEAIEAAEEKLFITASLGVTGSNETDTSLADILKRADAAMYEAKAGGRDRVVQIIG